MDVTHLLTGQTWEKGNLVATTRCGVVLTRRTTERLVGATAWDSRITCQDCRTGSPTAADLTATRFVI